MARLSRSSARADAGAPNQRRSAASRCDSSSAFTSAAHSIGSACAGVGELDVACAGDRVRQRASQCRARDEIVRAAHDQGRQTGECVEPSRRAVGRHRLELLHHDRRLIREIVTEERCELRGQALAVRRREPLRSHDERQHRVTPHAACADPCADRAHEHRRRQPRAVLTVGERAQERQAGDPRTCGDGDVLRDQAAHRVPREMKSLGAFRVSHSQRIGGHPLDGHWLVAGGAVPKPPIVDGHRPVTRRQHIGLRAPAAPGHANSLNHQQRRPVAGHLVTDGRAADRGASSEPASSSGAFSCVSRPKLSRY